MFPRPYSVTRLPHRDITMQNVPGEGDFDHYQVRRISDGQNTFDQMVKLVTRLPHRDITMQKVPGEGDFDHYQVRRTRDGPRHI